jgi:hypothetical protein
MSMNERDINRDELSDRELIDALYGEIREMERRVRNIELRYNDIPYTSSHINFILSIVILFFVFGLTIGPYLGLMKFEVPSVISYISAFANVFVAYIVHDTYRTLRFNRSLKQNTRYGLIDAKAELEQARKIYECAETEMEVLS